MADRIRPHIYLTAPRPNQAAVAFVVTDEAYSRPGSRRPWSASVSAQEVHVVRVQRGHADDVGYQKRQRCRQNTLKKKGE
jgi:hypothetical protein